MKNKKLMNAVTELPDEMIEEAKDPTGIRKPQTGIRRLSRWKRFAAAACAVLVLGAGGFAAFRLLSPVKESLASPLIEVTPAEPFPNAKELTSSQEFSSAVKEFSYETGSALLSGYGKNINYSPISLYYGLAVAATGAEGETKEELLDILNMTDTDVLSESCAHLQRMLAMDDGTSKLRLSNSVWMSDSVSWKQSFVENAAENFYASVYSEDMEDPATERAIGEWISEETEGTLGAEFELTPGTVMMILNTIYLYDEWVNQFNEGATIEKAFYPADGSSVTCSFMRGEDFADFARGENYTRAALPLKGGGEMVFILPDEGVSPDGLASSPEALKEAFEGGETDSGLVIWEIPKFSFDTMLTSEIINRLKELGAASAFDALKADFSALTDDMSTYISGITQETFIEINENGVEASAYTAIEIAEGAAIAETTTDMILNRPFLYGIRAFDGTLLFVGICENPAAQ